MIASCQYVKDLIGKLFKKPEYLTLKYNINDTGYSVSNSNNNIFNFIGSRNGFDTNMTMSGNYVLLKKGITYHIFISLLSNTNNVSYRLQTNTGTIFGTRGFMSLNSYSPTPIDMIYTPTSDIYVGCIAQANMSAFYPHCSSVVIYEIPNRILR